MSDPIDDMIGKKINDERLVYGELVHGCWLTFVPYGKNSGDESKAINIRDNIFEVIMLNYAIRKVIPQLSIYDDKQSKL